MTKARKLADLIDANGDVTVANLDNVTADAITAGTLSSDRLPTVPVSKGGTGATTLGSAGQFLKVNATATGVEYGTVTVPVTSVNGQIGAVSLSFADAQGYNPAGSAGRISDRQLPGSANCGNINCNFGNCYNQGEEIGASGDGTKLALRQTLRTMQSYNCDCNCK